MSLQIIQKRLKAPKSQYNSFGKYNYRNLEDIQEAAKPLLAEFEYSLVIADTMEEVGGRVYVKATATIYDKEMKVVVSNTAYAREALTKKGMDESQITGASSSYARKYALNGMFAIDDTQDADGMDNKAQPPAPKKSYTDYIVIIDKLDTVEKINDWLAKNWPEVQANLSKGDVDKFKAYATQVRDILAK